MRITTEDAAKAMRNTGWDAEAKGGIVAVRVDMDNYSRGTIQRIRKQLAAIGYEGSWGVRPYSSSAAESGGKT